VLTRCLAATFVGELHANCQAALSGSVKSHHLFSVVIMITRRHAIFCLFSYFQNSDIRTHR